MKPVDICVVVNGSRQSVASPKTIAQFLADAGWKASQVVVEHNGTVKPRHLLAETCLDDGDRLEVVVPVAGG